MQHTVEDGNCENVTVMCTVCADGTALPPVIIFKGQYFLEKWCQNNLINAVYVNLYTYFIVIDLPIVHKAFVNWLRAGQMVRLASTGSSSLMNKLTTNLLMKMTIVFSSLMVITPTILWASLTMLSTKKSSLSASLLILHTFYKDLML